MEMTTQPTLGRIVHYHYLGQPAAAIITAVPELLSSQMNYGPEGYVRAVHLRVFLPDGELTRRDVHYTESNEDRHWSWPPQSI